MSKPTVKINMRQPADSITEFPFIQAEKGCLYHQIGHKGRQLFYICFKINEKMVAFERCGGF